MNYERRIGYYELFNVHERQCDKIYPEDLEVAPLTHINLAFVLFDSSYKMIDTDGELISRVTFLKSRYQGLRVNVAIGGWAFNDPPTQTLFSDMASSRVNRQVFVGSLVSFISKYGLDGVDIDWEYPAATDRGGKPADTQNFILLMSEIREAFDAANPAWESTVTVPTSYWYLRGFDVTGLQDYVDWFNVMSYDLVGLPSHGMWDQHNKFTGPYLQGHTNITEIEQGLDLLWRNGVGPNKVVMGFAFYGRSFTMSDASCSKPGCTFSTSGQPGSCTNTGGILSYSEVSSRNNSLDVHTFYDPKSTVKYNVYNGNQWISYDDQQSFFDKKKYLTSRCLGGLMIWAIDQDNQNHDALSGLLGDFSSSQLEGGSLDDKSAAALSSAFGAYTGQNCFVTPTCTDGTDGQKQKDQVCPSGTMSVSTAHSPLQAPKHDLHGTCDEGWFRYICCPTKAMPKNCKWNGAPERSAFGCSGSCSKTQILLNTDDYVDDKGVGSCYSGHRSLCCDSTEVLDRCYWTGCQGPLNPADPAKCDHPDDEYQTSRFDQDNGSPCSDAYVSPVDGAVGSPLVDRFKRGFCCPKGKGYKKCNWSNDPQVSEADGVPFLTYDPALVCQPQPCGKRQTEVTQALRPPQSPLVNPSHTGLSCDGFSIPPGFSQEFPYCCEPPSRYSDDWPVDPKYLFEHYYNTAEDDVMWSYDNEFRNNNADKSQSNPGDEDGKDAYGFVMLDGAPGSLDNDFPDTHVITRRTVEFPKAKRSILTINSTTIDSTFEHAEEIVYVYCNSPQESPECQKVWYKGAEDTIIRLPAHVGEGPYARIVSMEIAEPEYQLPLHHIQARSLEGNTSPVYKMKFDYDFHLIKRDDVVNMRVDFTNLLGYWDDLTDEPASKRKRDEYAEHLSEEEWRGKIGKAKRKHAKLQKRREARSQDAKTAEMDHDVKPLGRRWFGKFLDWLGRLVRDPRWKYLPVLTSCLEYCGQQECRILEHGSQEEFVALQSSVWASLLADCLLKARLIGDSCPGQTFSANMKMYLDTDVEMSAVYAYYFSGTIVPPAVTGTYAYFSLEPSAYLGLRLTGNARLQATTGRKKLLDTISYPGLSIKGIAAVGPTLDLYGEIAGVVTLKGEMKAGAKLNFGKAEVYWPQDDSSSDKYQTLLGVKSDPLAQSKELIAPTFDAKVRVDAQIDIKVTPEANMGLRIGGKISGGSSLVDAQLVGYVNTSLSFKASASASGGSNTGTAASYSYGVYLFYNLGYGAYAAIKFFPNWALKPRNAFERPKRFTIYENTGSFTGPTKRSIDGPPAILAPKFPRRGLIAGDDWHGTELSTIDQVHASVNDDNGAKPILNESNSMNVQSLLGKRADDSLPDSQIAGFTSQLTCPPGNSAQVKLPDYRQPVDGICTGVQKFFYDNTLANSEMVLTWDNNEERSDDRRYEVCGNQNPCPDEQSRIRTATGNYRIDLSCDEFPFASSEEGGNFLRTLTTRPTAAERTCVPAWQNTLQGNCNKLLNVVQTNVAYFERSTRGDSAENFIRWDTPGWLSAGSNLGGPPGQTPQRTAAYPNQIPRAAGISASDYAASGNTLGYMYKRNFTHGLATPAGSQDGAAWTPGTGPAQSWTQYTSGEFPVGTFGGDVSVIACVVNTFGQDDIFQADYNGYCYNGVTYSTRGFGQAPSFRRCIVEFANGGRKKRSIGQFHDWDVHSIKMLDDDDK
ncbi:MAG: hypothetical protein Q9181_004891 [Wetmoreana brouardii]